MPYILKEQRTKFDGFAENIGNAAENPGDLNYAITVIIQTYMKKKGVRYENFNAVVGMLECAKLEFYRKLVAEYEDLKAEQNGDVNLLK
jgi:hypothetical protein